MAKYLDLSGLSHFKDKCDTLYATKSEIGSVLKFKGSVAFANRPSLSSASAGDTYNITDDFTTDNDFVEGSGKSYKAGTNIAVVLVNSVKKWDVLGGSMSIDFTNLTTSVSPATTETYNLGSSSKIWNNIYTKYINSGGGNNITIDAGQSGEYVEIIGHVIPSTGDVFDLGGTNDKWDKVYANTVNASTEVNSAVVNTPVLQNLDGDVRINPDNNLTINADALPYSNNIFDLGASALKWKDLYLSGSLKDGTNSFTIADIPGTAITNNEIDALFA